MSAPRPGAFASIFSLEPGTERHERRGRLRERSDMGGSVRAPSAILQPCEARARLRRWMPARLRRRSAWSSSAGWRTARVGARSRSGPPTAPAVLKLYSGALRPRRAAQPSSRTARAGYPAPATLAKGPSTWRDEIHELLPGVPMNELTPAAPELLADQYAATRSASASSRRAGPWVDEMVTSILNGRIGYCEHAAMARALRRDAGASGPALRIADGVCTARTCRYRRRRALRLLALQPADRWNLGLRGRRWDGATNGDATFDLVTLAHTRSTMRYATSCSPRRPHRPILRLPLYAAHMVLRSVDWTIRHHEESEVQWFLVTAPTCWRLSALGEPVGPVSQLRPRSRCTRSPTACSCGCNPAASRESATPGRSSTKTASPSSNAHGPLAVGAVRGRGRRLGRPVRRLLLTHAHIDHVGGSHALPERIGVRIAADERAARRRHAGGRLQGLHARVHRGVRRSRRDRDPPGDASGDRSAPSSRRGSSCFRPSVTPTATSSPWSPTSTCCSPVTCASSASRRSRSRATPPPGPTARCRRRARRHVVPGHGPVGGDRRFERCSSTSGTAWRWPRSRPARGTHGPNAIPATQSTSSAPAPRTRRDAMPPAMLHAMGFCRPAASTRAVRAGTTRRAPRLEGRVRHEGPERVSSLVNPCSVSGILEGDGLAEDLQLPPSSRTASGLTIRRSSRSGRGPRRRAPTSRVPLRRAGAVERRRRLDLVAGAPRHERQQPAHAEPDHPDLRHRRLHRCARNSIAPVRSLPRAPGHRVHHLRRPCRSPCVRGPAAVEVGRERDEAFRRQPLDDALHLGAVPTTPG